MWLILVVSFLTGQLYSQAPAVGQPVRVSSLGCNAVASSSHHQSPGLTLEQQACSPHFSLTGFSFSGPKRNSENDWSSRFGDRLSAVAMPVNNDFWSSALGVPGFGAGASQNQDNPPQSKTNPPASTVPESTTKDKKEQQTSPTATTGSPGHIFWVIPAYKVSYQKGFQPLTPKEKFQEWAKGSYDPLGLGAGAVCGQDYPGKPVRIVTSAAGGGGDFTDLLKHCDGLHTARRDRESVPPGRRRE